MTLLVSVPRIPKGALRDGSLSRGGRLRWAPKTRQHLTGMGRESAPSTGKTWSEWRRADGAPGNVR